ncbi:MAG TPA: carbohydrate kinase family protein [Thermomicrobiales bacterium]|nr:carbohydrate kinase family protein [Thermomicrobiales bacterium]
MEQDVARSRQDRPATNTHGSSQVLVSASIAYDLIMTFPGSFQDYILEDKAHVLSISFLFDSLVRKRGGIGGNIAWSLALLGERPKLVGAGGADFADYRLAIEAVGVDTSLVLDVPDLLTGSSFMMSDRTGNQIAGFYPGASDRAAEIDLGPVAAEAVLGIVSATALDVMNQHARQIAASGAKLVFDPAQQVIAMPGEDIAAGVDLAWMVVGSDYEHGIVTDKTGLTPESMAERVPVVVVTLGAGGSRIFADGEVHEIPVAPADPVVEVTGGGDAYRAGLIKGHLLGLPWPVAGRMASVSAVYAVEKQGPQEHEYTPEEFVARFDRTFPEYAGTITAEQLSKPAIAGTAG